MKRRLKGKVVSNKNTNTVTVEIERKKVHPIYRKRYTSTKKFLAHDENSHKLGDVVTIEETRPLSKNKRWQVVEETSKKEAK